MNLCIPVRDVADLNLCSKRAANESDFSIFEKMQEIGEMTIHYFIECLIIVTYKNSGIHRAFYFID